MKNEIFRIPIWNGIVPMVETQEESNGINIFSVKRYCNGVITKFNIKEQSMEEFIQECKNKNTNKNGR